MSSAYHDIRKLIERRYRRRIRFALHLAVFILALMVTAWYMLSQYPYTRDGSYLFFMVG